MSLIRKKFGQAKGVRNIKKKTLKKERIVRPSLPKEEKTDISMYINK